MKRISALIAIFTGLCLLTMLPVEAQTLGDLVDENGYLLPSSAFEGSVDASGWQVALDANGTPRFHPPGTPMSVPQPPPHPEDIYWENIFGSTGVVGSLRVVAVSGCNDIYVGGQFAGVGGVPARNIARWDGDRWYSVGDGDEDGVSGVVHVITVQGLDVYVGGRFDRAGSKVVNNVARWDGVEWNALSGGVGAFAEFQLPTPGVVYAIDVDGANVYVGGRFDSVGLGSSRQPAANIAMWNGTSWRTLAAGLNGDGSGQPPFRGEVHALAVGFDGLYAGGRFSTSGATALNGLARWDGTEWSEVGGGLEADVDNVDVMTIDVNGPDVYIGGRFDRVGGTAAQNIAVWAGMLDQWFPLGEGSGIPVQTLAVDGIKVYASGQFPEFDGARPNNIAVWDGQQWGMLGRPVNNGTDTAVLSVAVSSGNVYISGPFEVAGPASAGGIALWDVGTQTWKPLNKNASSGGGVNGVLYAMALTPDFLYVGGRFTSVGLIKTNSLARWNRQTGVWSALGGGIGIDPAISATLLPAIRAITVDGENIYVGGRFDFAGGVRANNVARWDGIQWTAIGQGIGPNAGNGPYDSTSTVYALAAQGGVLYAGGEFTLAGGTQANRVARWDEGSQTWAPLGGGIGGSSFNTRVNALAIGAEGVYVGGVFPVAGEVRASNIALFDGSSWQALGRGVNNSVFAIAVDDEENVYVGGNFSTAGGNDVNKIARWNGTTWAGVGAGFNRTVRALTVGKNGLYAAGDFLGSGAAAASRIARWNGEEWEGLGTGVDNEIGSAVGYAVAVDGDDVFVGGSFTIAGEKSSLNIAKWSKPGNSISTDTRVAAVEQSLNASSLNVQTWPNPIASSGTFSLNLPNEAFVRIALYNTRGEEVALIHEGLLSEGESRIRWSRNQLPGGVYFYRLQGEGFSEGGKLMVRDEG